MLRRSLESALEPKRHEGVNFRPALTIATGIPYTVARRQIRLLTLAEVMQQHPLLNSLGIGVYEPRARQRVR